METYRPNPNEPFLSTTDQCLVRIIELLSDIETTLNAFFYASAIAVGLILAAIVVF